jgi:hypothetical protein
MFHSPSQPGQLGIERTRRDGDAVNEEVVGDVSGFIASAEARNAG